MFGQAVYEAFRQVKQAFDPHNLLNPGKVVDAPPMTENLRYARLPPGYEPATVFDYSQAGRLRPVVEMCNGNGACRKTQGGTMCPSFRATLRRAGQHARPGQRAAAGPGGRRSRSAGPCRSQARCHDVLDLCLMCKACKAECPSNVDMAKLKAEFLQLYYRQPAAAAGAFADGRLPPLNRLGAPFARWSTGCRRARLVRWLLEKTAGIDRRRSLPPLHADHFRRWFARHRPDPPTGTARPRAAAGRLLHDLQRAGDRQAAVRVLEAPATASSWRRARAAAGRLSAKDFCRTQALVQDAVAGSGAAAWRTARRSWAWSRVAC